MRTSRLVPLLPVLLLAAFALGSVTGGTTRPASAAEPSCPTYWPKVPDPGLAWYPGPLPNLSSKSVLVLSRSPQWPGYWIIYRVEMGQLTIPAAYVMSDQSLSQFVVDNSVLASIIIRHPVNPPPPPINPPEVNRLFNQGKAIVDAQY